MYTHLIPSGTAFLLPPPNPLPPHGEAYLLLDGIQDAPHVLIHLQALQQSGFTGKGERWGLALAAGPKGVETQPTPPHCAQETWPLPLVTTGAPTGEGSLVTAWYKGTMHCPCNLSPSAMHLGQVGGGWTP